MKNKDDISIEKAYDIDDSFFKSRLFYKGEWAFGENFDDYMKKLHRNGDLVRGRDDIKNYDIMYLNALTDHGKNLYMEFLEKNYYKPLRGIFMNDSIVDKFYPHICSRDIGEDRYLTFNRPAILYDMYFSLLKYTQGKFMESIPDFLDAEKGYSAIKTAIRHDLMIFNDIARFGKDSQYYEYFPIYSYQKYLFDKDAADEKLEDIISLYSRKSFGIRYLPEVLEKKIDTDEFKKCFNYDKLCLIVAYSAYLDLKYSLKRFNSVSGSAMALFNYVDALKELKKFYPDYNVRILIPTEDGKISKISAKDIEEMAKKLTEEYPFILTDAVYLEELLKKFNVSKEATDAMSPMEYSEFLKDLIAKDKKFKSLTVSWELLPKKEEEESRENIGVTRNRRRVNVDREVLVERYDLCRNYIKDLPNLFTLKGINEFDGYLAYVYSNGKVILEKNVQDNNYYNATYIMNIENFFEISKLSRTEIINGLGDGSILGVRRIYHTKDIDKWKSRIDQEVSGDGYSKEVLDLIYKTIDDEMNKGDGNGPKRVLKTNN